MPTTAREGETTEVPQTRSYCACVRECLYAAPGKAPALVLNRIAVSEDLTVVTEHTK